MKRQSLPVCLDQVNYHFETYWSIQYSNDKVLQKGFYLKNDNITVSVLIFNKRSEKITIKTHQEFGEKLKFSQTLLQNFFKEKHDY